MTYFSFPENVVATVLHFFEDFGRFFFPVVLERVALFFSGKRTSPPPVRPSSKRSGGPLQTVIIVARNPPFLRLMHVIFLFSVEILLEYFPCLPPFCPEILLLILSDASRQRVTPFLFFEVEAEEAECGLSSPHSGELPSFGEVPLFISPRSPKSFPHQIVKILPPPFPTSDRC